MASLSLKNIEKVYPNGFKAVQDFNLEIADKEFIIFVGPSGCGKSTTLRMIAGLEDISGGTLEIDGKVMNDVEPKDRDIAMVFQNYALYPHMSVYDNMAFGLKLRKRPKDEIDKLVREAARILDLEKLLDRKPKALSGGQRQRVAMGRAIVRNPKVFLMDEPLSNLDAKLRLEMRYELQRLHVETGSTFVYVTHDQMEAMTLATKICLVQNGVLQQYAPPLEVYRRPENLFVADFVGNPSINFIDAKGAQKDDGSIELKIFDNVDIEFVPNEDIKISDWHKGRDSNLEKKKEQKAELMKDKHYVEKSNKDEVFKYHIAKIVEEDSSIKSEQVVTDEDFVLAVRPEAIGITGEEGLHTTIYGAMPTGMESTLKLRLGDYLLTSVIFGNTAYRIGEDMKINFTGDDILLFDRKSGMRIATGKIRQN